MPVAELNVGSSEAPVRPRAGAWLPAGITFLSAFLLFQVQPALAKAILPWFGGTAAVWTTCVLFFQTVLFLGYVYAHWLVERVTERRQGWIHIGLLAGSLLFLPAIPSEAWKPEASSEPALRILGLLSVTVGLPYLLLSSTSPLVQAWMARRGLTALPYRFYALSNLASLLALLAYPVAIEPLVPTRLQGYAWSGAFVAYAALMAVFARPRALPRARVSMPSAAEAGAPATGHRLLWLMLAALPSALSLAVTNHLCQNVAAIPFLWVLPLGVYLLSLILCFDGDGWSRRRWMLPLQAAALAGCAWVLLRQTPETPVQWVIPAYVAALLAFCMYLHGEMARRKPAPRHLTSFYLMMSLGGMLGGVLVSLGAPYLLSGYYEFPLALAACAFTTLMLEYRKHWVWDAVFACACVGSFLVAATLIVSLKHGARVTVRNFYGGLRILDSAGSGPSDARRTMVHGTISHGFQYLAAERRRDATTYYAPGSGVHTVLAAFQRPGMQVGVVGLGAGTLAVYSRSGDAYRFYEINPQVAHLARTEFSFLNDAQGAMQVAIGDGRLLLERERDQRFDLLAVDAFSGDSIPVHLLTREAIRLYLSRLKDDGALALHISNTALRIAPVVERIAADLKVESLVFYAREDARLGRSDSEWILLARKAALDRRPALRQKGRPAATPLTFPLWTDDYSNLFRILR